RCGSAAKQSPHRPGISRTYGLRARSDDLFVVSQTTSGWRANMKLHQFVRNWLRRRKLEIVKRRRSPGQCLRVQQLEDRTVPSNYTASNVSELIAEMNAANIQGGSNTIVLVPGVTFTLTQVDNDMDNFNGLPMIASKNNLTILGNDDIIERSTASPATFRLLDVASGASLTLKDLTLQGGYLWPSGDQPSPQGGAICNYGSLTM